jgi:hypothetical protein
MASPNLSELIATTLRDRSGKCADNVSKGNALLNKLKEKGAWESAQGRTIIQELEYSEGNFQWYSGYEAINVSPPDVISAAEFNWKQAASSVSISGLEGDIQNVGKAQVINLLKARIKNAEHTMKNQVCVSMYSDGTGSGGKEIGGLQSLIADAPTSGVVGGIDRQNFTFWRNQVFDATSDGTATSATTIQSNMNGAFPALHPRQRQARPDRLRPGVLQVLLELAPGHPTGHGREDRQGGLPEPRVRGECARGLRGLLGHAGLAYVLHQHGLPALPLRGRAPVRADEGTASGAARR